MNKGKDVESLSSYLQRLSLKHCITFSKLISLLYLPYVNDESQDKHKNMLRMLNGHGDLTVNFLRFLTDFSEIQNLDKLTLLNFKDIISTQKLFKNKKAWCPFCFEEMKKNAMPVYEKLIWFINYYDYCIEHSSPLLTRCPNCFKEQSIFSLNAQPGICNYCNAWLGQLPLANNEINKDIINTAGEIEELLNCFQLSDGIDLDKVKFSLSKILRLARENYWKRQTDFFNDLGFNGSVLSLFPGRKITLKNLLKINKKLNISLVDILSDTVANPLEKYSLPISENSEQYSLIKSYIKKILDSKEKVSRYGKRS